MNSRANVETALSTEVFSVSAIEVHYTKLYSALNLGPMRSRPGGVHRPRPAKHFLPRSPTNMKITDDVVPEPPILGFNVKPSTPLGLSIADHKDRYRKAQRRDSGHDTQEEAISV